MGENLIILDLELKVLTGLETFQQKISIVGDQIQNTICKRCLYVSKVHRCSVLPTLKQFKGEMQQHYFPTFQLGVWD